MFGVGIWFFIWIINENDPGYFPRRLPGGLPRRVP